MLVLMCVFFFFFFFKQKTAYEMRISDWSSDVCSSDLPVADVAVRQRDGRPAGDRFHERHHHRRRGRCGHQSGLADQAGPALRWRRYPALAAVAQARSEEHTSELQSLMRISYAVFCLKKKTNHNTPIRCSSAALSII